MHLMEEGMLRLVGGNEDGKRNRKAGTVGALRAGGPKSAFGFDCGV